MSTKLICEDLEIEIPVEITNQSPEEVVAYETAALDAACRAKHGKGIAEYRKAKEQERADAAKAEADAAKPPAAPAKE